MKQAQITTKAQLDELYNQSALTWEGLSTDEKNLKDVEEWIKSCGVDTSNAVVNITLGSLMNSTYHLHGSNAYPNDLTIVSITGINTLPLAIPRFQVGARWFDDIVDNNKQREKAKRRSA
ncbi:MAG: hypothetical protein NC218_02005 [Acetobacter sp.]|nr:hypothetical protein [Acetobacter sp.]